MARANLPELNGYQFECKIGGGSFADVYKVTRKDKTMENLAVKCFRKSKLSTTNSHGIITEIEILKGIHHAHIVELKDFAWDDNYIYLIMEYCSGGDLSHYIKKRIRLHEIICQRFIQQLALGLKFLRSKNISHFDLKPQNIFIASKYRQILKIGDFGLAQLMSEAETNTKIKGSLLYMAPEIIVEKKYDIKADIWSVGVILYECLYGKAPYSSSTIEELITKIKSLNRIKIPQNRSGESISLECRVFLENCLQKDPKKRINFEEFFNHPFLRVVHAPDENNSFDNSCISASTSLEKDRNTSGSLTLFRYSQSNIEKRSHLEHSIKGYDDHLDKLESISKTNVCEEFTGCKFGIEANHKQELHQLARSTPSMMTALEVCKTAELYAQEKKYKNAMDNYEIGLGRLIELIALEPPGRRRYLVMNEAKERMNQAEFVKTRLGSSREDTDVLLSKIEAERTCMLQ